MLFDLQQDGGEQVNVAAAHAETVKQLMASLDDWEGEMSKPKWPRVMNYRYVDEFGDHWFAI